MAKDEVSVQDVDFRRDFDVACREGAFFRGVHADGNRKLCFAVGNETNFFELQNDVRHVFLDPGDGGEFMKDAVNLDRRNGYAVKGGKQDTPEAISQCDTIASFEGLAFKLRIAVGFTRRDCFYGKASVFNHPYFLLSR